MDNSFKQLALISITLIIKLILNVEGYFMERDIYLNPFLYILLPLLQILSLIFVLIISVNSLKSKEPSNKFRNYIYIALSAALLTTSSEFLISSFKLFFEP